MQAILGLLADFDKKDISRNLIEQEIAILQQANISQDLLGLKQQILEENTSVIDTNTSVIDTNTSVIDTNTSVIDTNTSVIDKEKKHIYEKIDNLKNIYENNIEPTHKPNLDSTKRQEFYQEKKNIGNIESILQKNNIDSYLYFQIRYTAEQLIQSQETLTPDTISFISQFNTLNRSLNIDYQIDIPVESMQFANKPKNLEDVIKNPESVLAYESVRTFTQNQPDIRTKDKTIKNINPKLQKDIRNSFPDQTKESIIGKIKETCTANKLPVPVILSLPAFGMAKAIAEVEESRKIKDIIALKKNFIY